MSPAEPLKTGYQPDGQPAQVGSPPPSGTGIRPPYIPPYGRLFGEDDKHGPAFRGKSWPDLEASARSLGSRFRCDLDCQPFAEKLWIHFHSGTMAVCLHCGRWVTWEALCRDFGGWPLGTREGGKLEEGTELYKVQEFDQDRPQTERKPKPPHVQGRPLPLSGGPSPVVETECPLDCHGGQVHLSFTADELVACLLCDRPASRAAIEKLDLVGTDWPSVVSYSPPSIEGSWLGPDKVAHALFCPAVTWGGALALPAYWWAFWLGSIVLGVGWEASNRFWVLKGDRGISIKDGIAFGVGWMGAGLLLLATRGG